MIKSTLLILLFSFVLEQSFSQSNQQIKRNSDNNRNTGTSGNSSNTSTNNNSTNSESSNGNGNYNSGHSSSSSNYINNGGNCDGACLELGCNLSLQLIPVLVNWQKKRLEKANRIGRIINLKGEGVISANPSPYFIAQPQICGTWGLLSSSIRYYAAVDKSGDLYNTLDWQLLELNFVQTQNFDLKIGTGFMKELFSNRAYWENTLSTSFYSNAYPRLKMNTTFRYASDGYEWAKYVPRIELNTKFQYDIYKTNKWNWGIETGVIYSSNFGVEIWGIQAGIYYQTHHLENPKQIK
ncbi:MAG: hypothetical protein RL065_532 [Bacteroidota bacterium]|jgi:hypothetical protein